MTNKQTKPVSLFLSSVITANPQCQLQTGKATSTAHKNKFNGWFFLCINWFNYKGLPHSHLFPSHQSRYISVSPAVVSDIWKNEEWRGKSWRYTAHTEELWKLFSFKVTNSIAHAKKAIQEIHVATVILICLRASTQERCLWCYLGVIQTKYFQKKHLAPPF